MASREGSGSGGASSAGGGTRALHAVAQGPVFRTGTAARAERASGAVARRWAPDGAAASGAPALRALRFADRHLSAYLGAGHPMRGRRRDAVPSADWLSPAPWFGDELDWMSAARAAIEESARAWPGEARIERARAGRDPSVRPSGEQVGLPIELVAPGLRGRRTGDGPRAAWRAYAPLLDGAAARAAEFLAELVIRPWVAEEGIGRRALLDLVTAADLAGGDPQREVRRPGAGPPRARSVEPGATRGPIDAGGEVMAGVAAASTEAQKTLADVAAGRGPSSRERAIELLAGSVAAGRGLALAAGPRVLLPAGLGGFVSGAAAARAVDQPMGARPKDVIGAMGAVSSLPRLRPAALDHVLWADRWLARFAGASGAALRSFDAASGTASLSRSWRPAEWTPAWVAPAAPAARRRAPAAAALPSIIVDDDEPVADQVFSAIAAAAAADRQAGRGSRAGASRAGAIESMAPEGRRRSSLADRALAGAAIRAVSGGAEPVGARAPAAGAARVSSGLGASLAASPLAPLFAALVELAPQRAFDARLLSTAGLAGLLGERVGRGVQVAAGPAPASPALRHLAASAPGAVWLASRGARHEDRWRRAADPERSRAEHAPAGGGAMSAGEDVAQALAAASTAQARPGHFATRAQSFADARTASASDLALDFVTPEMLAAARAAGVGPVEAARAQRLAAAGRPRLRAMATAVDRVFVDALAPAPAAATREGAEAREPPATLAAAALVRSAPVRAPRGAFLLPDATGRALGVTGAASLSPDVAAALELVAAGRVAEAAAASPKAGAASGEATPPSRDVARARLPRELWPIFDAVHLSFGASAETRPLAPSARAARALALASRSVAPGDTVSPGERAAAAWAALPVVLPGGDRAGRAFPSQGRALGQGVRGAAARVGEALGALVAPTMMVGDASDEHGASAASAPRSRAQAWSPAIEAPLVATGATPPAATAPAMSPLPPPPPPPPSPAAERPAELDTAWFEQAARKHFADAGPASGGISLAEMILVTTAPRAQIAASPRTADRAVSQAASTRSAGTDGGKPDGAAAPVVPDIDRIAQEVFEQICRIVAVARERSGDPWQR